MKTDFILTDVLEIHYINMVKFRLLETKDIQHNLLERWLSFLDEMTPEYILQEIITMDATIQKTDAKLQLISMDKEALRQYHLWEMAMSDHTTAINTATEKGIVIGEAKGVVIGEAKGIEKIAKRMKRRGVPIEQIVEDTGLSPNEIVRL